MADYISREAAWNGIYKCPTKTDADGYIWVRTSDVAHMIDDIPAADVVEVVRCRDCKFSWKTDESDLEYKCIDHSVFVSEEWYCADGKVRQNRI